MRKIILLTAIGSLLAACAPIKPMDDPCPGNSSAHDNVFLDYNEDGINIRANTKVYKKAQLWIKLRPSQNFRDTLVEIDGVTGTLPGGAGSTDPNWLDASGTWTSEPNRRFVLCVPDVASGTEYKFDVIIEGLGRLDPRVHVR